MELELHSARLYLRPFDPSDLDLDIEMATDADVMKYFGGAVTEEQITEESINFTRRCGGGCIGVWTVIHRLTQEKLGEVFLTPLPIDADDTNWELIHGDDLPEGEIEIGYLFKRSTWGNGYATEASKRLLQFAFEETPLEELVATTDSENTASQRVLEKCGLVYEGLRRAYAAECPGFRITRREWLEGREDGSEELDDSSF
jgi:RimJ/RimL family protein N-acetyltransferase